MNMRARVYVAGHTGLVGSALCRALRQAGYTEIVTRTHSELDLCDQSAVNNFFANERPDYVFLAAGRVGGIHANNTYPADFVRENLQIQSNVIDAAWRNKTRKLLNFGSSCVYPKYAPQPIHEDALLGGALEPTNEWYAIAKIAGLKMCQAYRKQYSFDAICLMPTNLYGPGDNFHPMNSHVLPAILARLHDAMQTGAKFVTIWGTGTPRREFLFVDDLADAALMLMNNYSDGSPINVGTGSDISIYELTKLVAEIVGFEGEILTDPTKPDGTPRKVLDVSKLSALGWKPTFSLSQGLEITYNWFRQNTIRTHG